MKKKLYQSIPATFILVLTLSMLPYSSASAQILSEPASAPDACRIASERLERVWLHETQLSERLDLFLAAAPQRIEQARELLEKAKANGRDTSPVEPALWAFREATLEARSSMEAVQAIIQAHEGFNPGGKVTDCGQAIGSIRDLAGRLMSIWHIIKQPARDLMEALRVFRLTLAPTGIPVPSVVP